MKTQIQIRMKTIIMSLSLTILILMGMISCNTVTEEGERPSASILQCRKAWRPGWPGLVASVTAPILVSQVICGTTWFFWQRLIYKFRHSTGHKKSVRPLDKDMITVYWVLLPNYILMAIKPIDAIWKVETAINLFIMLVK